MAMSWGWTPICQIGGDRYRISADTERSAPPPVVIGSSQCGTVQSMLPSSTSVSVVLPANQQGTVSTQLSLHPLGTRVTSSFSTQPSQVTDNQPLPSEERAVRRSPRLAQSTRVSCRADAESQLDRGRNQQWNAPRPPVSTMWNSNRNLSNNSMQPNKNYSIYNFEGHVNPVTNTSVSVVYNHSKHINVTHSRLHPAPISLSSKSGGNAPTTPTSKPPARKVKIKDLAFYEIVSTLIQEEIYHDGVGPLQRIFKFSVSDEEVKHLKDRKRKHPYLIQLRLCKLDSSCEQNDYYPVTHQIALNSQQILLPGLESMPRGPMRPMDVTRLCQLNFNSVNFLMVRCWESCKVFVRVVEKFTSHDLLDRLEKRSLITEEDTTNEIKKKLQVDQSEEGIASTTLQCSLMCPLSRTRMKLPCRASTCNHLQCFDAATYLQLNECKPKWSCPVCYQSALFDDLLIDGYFKRIIDEHTSIDKIELHPDGNWTPVEAVKKKSQPETECAPEQINAEVCKSADLAEKSMVILDSDDDDDDGKDATGNGSSAEKKNHESVVPAIQHRQSESSEIETIVLSDDDSPVEDMPIVTSDTYTSNTSAPVPGVNNTVDLESEQLAYIFSSRVNSLFGNYQPFEHSITNLCIPFSRTSTQFNQNALSITPLTNHGVSDSGMFTNFEVSGETHSSKNQRVSKSKNKKTKKLNNSCNKSSSQKKNSRKKRRRIVSESASESSRSSASSKITKARANHKRSNIQKRQNLRRISDSSESEKSSGSSCNSSSVNLLSSTDSSGSSSESSDREDSDNSSEKSFESGVVNPPEASSRVLRSQAQKRKKKSSC